ncbi:MAG: hypothetical protein HXY35_06925 [Chloroflexi bacterium]|nr:hypothetical protein [Chloroflexota bacterium]
MLVALGVACNVTPQGTSAPETVVTQNSPTVDPTATQTNMPNASDRTQPGVLVLTHAQPKGTAEGVLTAPGHGKQNFTIVPIDVTDFQSGGTLTVEITLGNGESDGSFDLFPEGAVIPTEGRVENSVAALYDLKHGESGTLTYKFDSGQVFQFGATGNWFSREGATNTFTVTAMVDANQAADVPSIPALELLAQRPFKPTDISLFFPSVYPSDLPLLDATGDPPSEDEVRGMLEEYLKARYPDDPAKVKKGIALYNNPETFLKISSPSLRAAFVALTDTVAEPAIDYILHAKTTQSNSKVALVRFSKFPANRSNTIAMVSPFGLDDPEVIAIEFNERFQAEMPFLFTNTLAHEALHQGDKDSNSIVQEEVCYAFDTLVYLEQLAYYPELAQAGTWLSRWMNTNALSRLNSGSGSELGLYDSNGNLPIWPDSDKDTPSFDERFSDNPGRDTVSPGNELLKQYLAQIAENGKAIPDNTDFSVELLHWISDNQAEVTPDELIAAAKALKLDILSVSR